MSVGKLTSVAVPKDGSLHLTWDDSQIAMFNLGPLIAARPGLAPLKDSAEFSAASLSSDGWSVEWPCGIDFGSTQLRRWADEQAGEAMSAAAFRAWMDRHSLTLDRASEALGLSRRIIAYYLSGEQPVSKTVMLATEGFDQRQAA